MTSNIAGHYKRREGLVSAAVHVLNSLTQVVRYKATQQQKTLQRRSLSDHHVRTISK